MLKLRRTSWTPAGVGVLAGVIVLGGILAGCPGPDERGGQAVQGIAGGDEDARSEEAIVQRLKDAVVLVEVERNFGGEVGAYCGSGFVITETGRIITNAHVVSPQVREQGTQHTAVERAVRVVFHAGTEDEEACDAEVVRENSELDLALLKVQRETPVFLELGDADAMQPTDEVIAAGHPLGLRELSLRTGSVSAHRTFEGTKFLEHDAEADDGNSGCPVVNEQGQVVGVHTQTRISSNMSTKWAVPSNVVRTWLASDPGGDPPVYFASEIHRPTGAEGTGTTTVTALSQLLDEAGLMYSQHEGGTYELPYANNATVYVHEWDGLLRTYVIFGELPSADAAAAALAFNYHDPVGRLSLSPEGDGAILHWEAQVPLGVVTPQYLRDLCDTASSQVENFAAVLEGAEIETPTELYPGGDDEALFAELGGILDESGLTYDRLDESTYEIPFEGGVTVYASVFSGVGYVHSYTGGSPGETEEQVRANALELLHFNWQDPIGRLSLDDDYDVVWECQVPMSYLTPDYLYIVANIAVEQVGKYHEAFGDVPFNAER